MRIISLVILIVLAGCRVEKTTDERYKVEPVPQAEEAARDAGEEAAGVAEKLKEEAKELAESPTGQKVKEGAKQVGEGLETAAREAAAATGRGLEKAGKKIQEHAKPDEQKP